MFLLRAKLKVMYSQHWMDHKAADLRGKDRIPKKDGGRAKGNGAAAAFLCSSGDCAGCGRVAAAGPGKEPAQLSGDTNPPASRKTPAMWPGRHEQMCKSAQSTQKEHTGRATH